MDAAIKIDLAVSKKSFFNRAAWFSLFAPIISAPVTIAVVCMGTYTNYAYISADNIASFLLCAFCLQVISLVLGIVSLFGIFRHGASLILWKAALGILASCGMGFVILVMAIGNAMGHGC